jgi:anti-anti-sigma factor
MSDDGAGVVLSTASGDATRLHLAGELSHEAVDRLSALVDDVAGPGACVVADLSRADALPLGLLRALVGAHRRLRDSGGSLVLADPSPAAARVLRISGLHLVLTVQGWPAAASPPETAAAEPA